MCVLRIHRPAGIRSKVPNRQAASSAHRAPKQSTTLHFPVFETPLCWFASLRKLNIHYLPIARTASRAFWLAGITHHCLAVGALRIMAGHVNRTNLQPCSGLHHFGSWSCECGCEANTRIRGTLTLIQWQSSNRQNAPHEATPTGQSAQPPLLAVHEDYFATSGTSPAESKKLQRALLHPQDCHVVALPPHRLTLGL